MLEMHSQFFLEWHATAFSLTPSKNSYLGRTWKTKFPYCKPTHFLKLNAASLFLSCASVWNLGAFPL